jgi:hypothetical protein
LTGQIELEMPESNQSVYIYPVHYESVIKAVNRFIKENLSAKYFLVHGCISVKDNKRDDRFWGYLQDTSVTHQLNVQFLNHLGKSDYYRKELNK